jgi:hypothetical protein
MFLYIDTERKNPGFFMPMTWFYANINIILITLGMIFFSNALNYGKGGPVQAVQETKTIVQTILNIAVDG